MNLTLKSRIILDVFYYTFHCLLVQYRVHKLALQLVNSLLLLRTGASFTDKRLAKPALSTVNGQAIDLSHKSHNASVPYPTMHLFVTEMCTFLLQNGALWDIWCIMGFLRWVYYIHIKLWDVIPHPCLNTLRPRGNEQHFADDIFKRIFFNENVWISIKISLKFVPRGPINNISALVQIMVWRRSGNKPLSEPMMVSLPTHIYVTRPQWVNFNGSLVNLLLKWGHGLVITAHKKLWV